MGGWEPPGSGKVGGFFGLLAGAHLCSGGPGAVVRLELGEGSPAIAEG